MTATTATDRLVVEGERWRVTMSPVEQNPKDLLAADLRSAMDTTPPSFPARWFYDETGSRLFDEITRLPEYYPTRRETEILTARAADIAARSGAGALVELGSGTSTKTRLLLDAFTAGDAALTFVPLDVSAEVLVESAVAIAEAYPSVFVDAHVADFAEPLPTLPGAPGTRLLAFLGGTIGTFDEAGRAALLSRIAAALDTGDHFLLGADLVKDARRLVAAYDDAAGVTAAFNKNLVAVLTTELDAVGIDPDDFAHVARWNDEDSRIEMWLRAERDIVASFRAVDTEWKLPAGTEILTEISVKFRLDRLHAELGAHGFDVAQSWCDARGDFSLTLCRVGTQASAGEPSPSANRR